MNVQEPEEQFDSESLEPKMENADEPQAPPVDSARDEIPAEEARTESSVRGEAPASTPDLESGSELDSVLPSDNESEMEAEAPAAQPKREYASARSRSGEMAQVEVPPDASEPAWYVIHCYSGYENKVRHNLEQRIETMGMKDKIFDVVVPTQEEIEVRDGKRRTVERHIFPGYVLVNMKLSEESWYVVRNTPGVTGFVGMGNMPTPLRPEEVSQIIKRMEAEAPTVKVTFKVGERVRIIDGPFNDFRGTVSEIDMERTKVRVMVSFFGRETPVELDFLQVEKS